MLIRINQRSAINTNYSKDFTDYLAQQGLDATRMSATEQTQQVQTFVAQKINSQYGIKTNLQQPTMGGTHVGDADSGNLNAAGLDMPSTGNVVDSQGNKIATHAQDAMTDFKDNQGNAAGRQLLEQAQVAGNIAKNVGQQAVEFVDNIAHDITNPSTKK